MRALHMVSDVAQLGNLERTDYTHVVANPGFMATDVQRIRDSLQQPVVVLQTVNAHSIPEWGKGNARLDDLRGAMAGLTSEEGGWERLSVTEGKSALVDFTMEAAAELAWWITSAEPHFDGTYIDEVWGNTLPAWFASRSRVSTTSVEWAGYRDTLLRNVAKYTTRPVIVNSAGFIPRAGNVQGICIEAAHMDPVLAISRFMRARDRGLLTNIGWGYELDQDDVVMPGDRLAAA